MPETTHRRRAPERTCLVCGAAFAAGELHPWVAVRPGVSDLIAREHADWAEGASICRDDLAAYRRRYVESLLADERGELGRLERRVMDSVESGIPVSRGLLDPDDAPFTFGERMADRVAAFGGSWRFILIFCGVLTAWMILNATGWLFPPFDLYPFILLNLVLSCIAAMQAPVIMMSQRRQEEKDRQRAENDYLVNLKAELEIRQLHEKIDHQIARQWERLAEMQQIQIELLEERNRDGAKRGA